MDDEETEEIHTWNCGCQIQFDEKGQGKVMNRCEQCSGGKKNKEDGR